MNRLIRCSALALLGAVALVPFCSAEDHDGPSWHNAPLATNQYAVTNLTANTSGAAPNTDPNLVNPWGLSRSSSSPWWVSDNGTGLSTLYSGTGATIPLVVTIPPADPSAGTTGSPTGTIYNGTTEFLLSNGQPAKFLFSTEDGTISGWNGGAAASITVNESKAGASFKGLTAAIVNLPGMPNETLLYAADFTLGRIEVFDSAFHRVRWVEDRLNRHDDLPEDYSPFNVQNLGGDIYVAYAKRGSGINEQDGAGLGEVRIYRPDGSEILRLQHGSWFNAPWGLAIAPSDFGPYSHSILVGNFGSGWVAAFDPITGSFQDFLRDASGNILSIPGLWALSPGSGSANSGSATAIYFAAGGANEASGVLGAITAIQNPQGNDQ